MTAYPRIAALGLAVIADPMPHVRSEDLAAALGYDRWTIFTDLFGIQTQYIGGPYADDVERVLGLMGRDK